MGLGFRVWGLGFRVQGYVGLIGIGRHTETKHCWGFGVGVLFHGKEEKNPLLLVTETTSSEVGDQGFRVQGLGSRV